MPLLLADLDNTLIDRASAFARWAREFTSAQGGGTADAQWLTAADNDGLEPRERLAALISERFGLSRRAEARLVTELRGGLVQQIVPDDAVIGALRDARAAGWVPFVVTNGTVLQQEHKLRHTGLDREVAGWIISEAAGIRKPDPDIFRLAAARAGLALDGAWMIGDSAEADIGGARNAGLPSVWLHRGRPWPLTAFQPSHTAGSFPHAVEIVLAASSALVATLVAAASAGRGNDVATGYQELSGVFVAILQDGQKAGTQRLCLAESLKDVEPGGCHRVVLKLDVEELLRGRRGECQRVLRDLHAETMRAEQVQQGAALFPGKGRRARGRPHSLADGA